MPGLSLFFLRRKSSRHWRVKEPAEVSSRTPYRGFRIRRVAKQHRTMFSCPTSWLHPEERMRNNLFPSRKPLRDRFARIQTPAPRNNFQGLCKIRNLDSSSSEHPAEFETSPFAARLIHKEPRNADKPFESIVVKRWWQAIPP